jgi:hypothetical protein
MTQTWKAEAFNQDPDSPNEIHGDDLAKQYGFQGGLVPGVTISTYLAHPAINTWGMEFLQRGFMHAKIVSPLYDHETFCVHVDQQSATAYAAELSRPDGTLSAIANVHLEDNPPPPPVRRGDRLAPLEYKGVPASHANCVKLRDSGCAAFRYHWNSENIMRTYLRDAMQMPEVLRGEKPYANMSFILAVSNWAAAGNLHMNPWIHLETHSQNYREIADETTVIAETAIVDLFEKKGHEFFDAEVNLYDESDDSCLTAVRLRAIYKLRAPDAQ